MNGIHGFEEFADKFWAALKFGPNVILDGSESPAVQALCLETKFFQIGSAPGQARNCLPDFVNLIHRLGRRRSIHSVD